MNIDLPGKIILIRHTFFNANLFKYSSTHTRV